jgi:hypothetical protein
MLMVESVSVVVPAVTVSGAVMGVLSVILARVPRLAGYLARGSVVFSCWMFLLVLYFTNLFDPPGYGYGFLVLCQA